MGEMEDDANPPSMITPDEFQEIYNYQPVNNEERVLGTYIQQLKRAILLDNQDDIASIIENIGNHRDDNLDLWSHSYLFNKQL